MKYIYITLSVLLLINSSVFANEINVEAVGAKGDSATINTMYIQRAIDSCHALGGGRVYFPKGNFITGTIEIKSDVDIYLDKGAVIYGSTDLKDYPIIDYDYDALSLSWSQTVLIYANKAKNVSILGYGEINGMGDYPTFSVFVETPDFLLRPFMLRFVDCENVKVDGVKLSNSAYWVQHYLGCRKVLINNVTVNALSQHNNDGIDIDDCTDVIISNCNIQSEDDGICLKSNGIKGCKNIVITNCIIKSSCNGIKLGTETTTGFDKVTISNCVISLPTNAHSLHGNPKPTLPVNNPYEHPTFFGTPNGLGGIVIESVDGAVVKDININNIVMDDIATPIFLRLGFRGRKYIPTANKPVVGEMSGITISNITATSASPIASSIVGIPGHHIENVSISNVNYKIRAYNSLALQDTIPENIAAYPSPEMFGILPASGFYVRHAKKVKFDNIQFTADSVDNRPIFYFDDAIDAIVSNCTFYNPVSTDMFQSTNSENITIKDCISSVEYPSAFKNVGNTQGIYLIDNFFPNTDNKLKTVKSKQIMVKGNYFK